MKKHNKIFICISFVILLSIPLHSQKKGKSLFQSWIEDKALSFLPFPKRKVLDIDKKSFDEIIKIIEKYYFSGDPKIKAEALLTLSAISPTKHFQFVLESINSKNKNLREYAIISAGLSGKGTASIPLGNIINKWEKDIECGVLSAYSLGLLGDEKGASVLQQKLRIAVGKSQKRLNELIKSILISLYLCGTSGDAVPIVFLLDENKISEPDLKGYAFLVSAALEYASVEKKLLKAVKKKWLKDYAIPALGFSKNNKKAINSLYKTALSKTESFPLRVESIIALGRIGSKEALLKLRKLAKKLDPPLSYVLLIARAMAGDNKKDFIKLLTTGLKKGTVPEERSACGIALGILNTPECVTALNNALTTEKNSVALFGIILGAGITGENAFAEKIEKIFFDTLDVDIIRISSAVICVIDQGRDMEKKLNAGIIKWKTHFLWKRRLRWSGLFGGIKTFALVKKLISSPDLPPSIIVEAMRALRVLGDKRKNPPALKVLFHKYIPLEETVIKKVKKIVWGE